MDTLFVIEILKLTCIAGLIGVTAYCGADAVSDMLDAPSKKFL